MRPRYRRQAVVRADRRQPPPCGRALPGEHPDQRRQGQPAPRRGPAAPPRRRGPRGQAQRVRRPDRRRPRGHHVAGQHVHLHLLHQQGVRRGGAGVRPARCSPRVLGPPPPPTQRSAVYGRSQQRARRGREGRAVQVLGVGGQPATRSGPSSTTPTRTTACASGCSTTRSPIRSAPTCIALPGCMGGCVQHAMGTSSSTTTAPAARSATTTASGSTRSSTTSAGPVVATRSSPRRRSLANVSMTGGHIASPFTLIPRRHP